MLLIVTSCSNTSDPALDTIKQAIQNIEQNPSVSYEALDTNLNKVKTKQIIEVLLDYLQREEQKDVVHNDHMGLAVFYLEKISGIKSHMDLTIAGPSYRSKLDWEEDLKQWRDWWNVNKDYIYWDEQAQALKVKPH